MRPARLAACLAALALTSPVAAEPGDEVGEVDELFGRHGVHLGIGIGLGHLACGAHHCNGITEAIALDAHLGTMLGDRWGLRADVWGLGHGTRDGVTATQLLTTAGVQAWLLPRLWVSAGVDAADTAPGAVASLGYEIIYQHQFVIDAKLRVGAGLYGEGVSAGGGAASVGFNWY